MVKNYIFCIFEKVVEFPRRRIRVVFRRKSGQISFDNTVQGFLKIVEN
jgi:hypothetical protein